MREVPPTAGLPEGRASVLLRCSKYVRSVIGSLSRRLESLETVRVVSEAYRSEVCLSHVSSSPDTCHHSLLCKGRAASVCGSQEGKIIE